MSAMLHGCLADTDYLEVTLNEVEVLGDIAVYREIARSVLTAREQFRAGGQAAAVSTALLDETHLTGLHASFLSYLKECHVR